MFYSVPVVGSPNGRSVESLFFVAPHVTSPFPVVVTLASLSVMRGPASHVLSPSPKLATVLLQPGKSPALQTQSWSSLALIPVHRPWIVGYTPAPHPAILDPAHLAHLPLLKSPTAHVVNPHWKAFTRLVPHRAQTALTPSQFAVRDAKNLCPVAHPLPHMLVHSPATQAPALPAP